MPARVCGRHVVRERQSSPLLAQASRVSLAAGVCARVTGKAGENGQNSGNRAAVPTLDITVGSRVWRHTQGFSKRPAPDPGRGSSSKTALGSLSTGSPPGRTPLHRDRSMYGQAYVRIDGSKVAVRYRGH